MIKVGIEVGVGNGRTGEKQAIPLPTSFPFPFPFPFSIKANLINIKVFIMFYYFCEILYFIMITLSRGKLLLLSALIILAYYFINRISYLYKAEFTNGIVVPVFKLPDWKNSTIGSPVIAYSFADSLIKFEGTQYLKYNEGDTVPVVFNPDEPEDAYIFTFMGFWYSGLIWCLWPLMIASGLILGFIRKNQFIIISLKYPLLAKRKKVDEQLFKEAPEQNGKAIIPK